MSLWRAFSESLQVPNAFDGVRAGFYLDKGENVDGLTSPRLLARLISPPARKASGLVIASRNPVTVVEFLEVSPYPFLSC